MTHYSRWSGINFWSVSPIVLAISLFVLNGKCINSWMLCRASLPPSLRSLWLLLSVLTSPWSFFVVSSPWLVLNADVRDELLGYAADVRLSAVSCLQIHLGIDSPPPHSLSLSPFPSAEKSCKIKTNPPHNLTEDNVILLSVTSVGACLPVSVGMFFFS